MREAMRGLVQGIVASHEARAAGLASLRQNLSARREPAKRRLREMRETRLESARGLRAHLAKIRHQQAQKEAHRKRVVRRALTAIASDQQAAQASTRTALKGMAKYRRLAANHRRVTAQHLRDDLARGMVELQKARTQRRAATRAGLQDSASHRRGIAQELRQNLFREIRGWLRQAATARKVEARQLRESLSSAKANLVQAGAQRRPVVEVWLNELTSDRLAARHDWRQMIAALQKRRSGVIAPEAPAPTPPREKAVEEVSAVAAGVGAAKRATRSKGGRRRSGKGH